MEMFCYQCEQRAKDTGCTVRGVCGKEPEVSAYIDLTVHMLKGLSQYAHQLRKINIKDQAIDAAVLEGLFLTVTNVNFDSDRYRTFLNHLAELRMKAKGLYEDGCRKSGIAAEKLTGPALFELASDESLRMKQAEVVSITNRRAGIGEDILGLQELLTYGLKGMAAYADHAQILGQHDDKVYAFFHEALSFLATNPTDINALLGMSLRCGETNIRAMELLDAGNTGKYGHPEPTKVRITPIKGKAILVSGHDLVDLEALLKQTEGKGINVYTHGEMLPTNAYPELKKFKHLVGNYGGAWQEQQKEFEAFPGAILMTTNCIQRPMNGYKARIFTTGLVGWPGVIHIKDRNFGAVIESAIAAPGFERDEPEKSITVGFARNTIMSVAGTVVDAVKAGKLKHFFLIGGCDGAKPGRNYYTEFAEKVPKDCAILTLACGKYRFNKLEFGDIGGIPRLLDCGQCNDAYSAVQVAVALSKAFNCEVNDLPLSFILSWYEQKAVAVLLSLLHLGIKNMRVGPSLPAFVTPPVLKVLVEKFNLMPITTPDADLKAILN